MSSIFISYRRQDTAPYAGRLHDRLTQRYAPEQVFMDLEIPPGEDFVEVIQNGVGGCSVFLALIGPGWLTAASADGQAAPRRSPRTTCASRSRRR